MSRREQRRPWCLPCRELTGDTAWASVNGVVCEWHWGILSDADQAALTAAIREFKPRGGRITTVIGQIVVVRMRLRSVPNTVYATWKAEADDYLADDDHKLDDWRVAVAAS